jgi:osmotically inducible lipoprotein OsmB
MTEILFPLGEMLMKFLPLGVAIVFAVLAIILTIAVAGCTTTQRAVTGAAAGGVTGALVAGPIGAAVGAGGGAVAGSVIGGRG